MTEDEARTKWCPMIQITVGATNGFSNRGDTKNINQLCIASDCMWWVWDIKWDSEGVIKEGEGHCGATK